MSPSPRVTLGVATYARDTYLAEAVASCLAQDFADLEVLVVVDGAVNPRIDEVLATFDDPRLRIVHHAVNRGISEAYNTIVREGRGELIAMLGDDDVCLPDRIARQVAVFDAHPETGVVHGDAVIIDEQGRPRGRWRSGDFTPGALERYLLRTHNPLVDPSRMVHRRVHEAVGGYHPDWTLAQDFHLWLRAVPAFRFRHAGGDPLIKLRRHGENFSDESSQAKEVAQVEAALREHLERRPLRALVPELDWPVLHPDAARRRALEVLADAFATRGLPLPGLAAELRERAAAVPAPPAPRRDKGRLLLTAFGFNDPGGGTTVPRVAAKELVRRGWDVTVFHASTVAVDGAPPYTVREWEEDGVRLVGVHNRPHALWDLGRPDRELDDPPVTAAFADVLDRLRPDVVHFHNLHNLGAALIDVAAARGVPAYFTTHNYWVVCPQAYLLRDDGSLCGGPGDGARCASCVGSPDVAGHQERLAGIRERFARGIRSTLAVSHGVRRTLVDAGHDAQAIDVVRQGVPAHDVVWEEVGRDRAPGRVGDVLTVGFFGSALAHKGPQLLVAAAQVAEHEVRVRIHGELQPAMRDQLQAIDERGVVELCGAFSPDELPGLLRTVDAVALPSLWWDCAPLVAAESLAARVPVLAPRMGGLAEAIRHEVDGLAFAGRDFEDLAVQLDRLAGEPGLLERLQAGITAPHGFAAYVDDLEAVYAGGRPGRVHEEPAPAVRWHGDFDVPTSLARVNREVTRRLAPVLPLERHRTDSTAVDPPLPHVADVEVRHVWPPFLEPPTAGRVVLIQPFEWGTLPRAWVEPVVAHFDEVWAPSGYVARQYLDAGVAADRVHVVPNGVDLDDFAPGDDRLELDVGAPGAVRFLFVGSAIPRKGIDVLLTAWRVAFPAGDEDVALVIKDFGADGIYRGGRRDDLAALVAADPRVLHLTRDLDDADVPRLLRAADVLVHPYRGEGFGMPILEAMATALPVIVTEGGAADEFCPPEAGWRVRSAITFAPRDEVAGMPTVGTPWELEPDPLHLAARLREAAASPEARARRGAAGRAAAAAYSWDAVAAQYAERARALAARPPRLAEPPTFDVALLDEAGPLVLATPAWRGADRLDELLAAWADAGAGTLVLVADPAVDGPPEALEAHVVDAAARAGVDLEHVPDIALRLEPHHHGRDARLHAETDAYVPLHAACAGHERLARAAGSAVLAPSAAALRTLPVPAGTR